MSCEASLTFKQKIFQNEHVRGFLNCSGKKRRKRAFRARLPQLFKQDAFKTSISCEISSTFQARSFQNLAPATQNAKMTSHLESLKSQNEHFVRDFLQIPHFQLENRRFHASFSFEAIFFTELNKYDFCTASATFQRHSPNAAPATTFDTVSRLRNRDKAIHGKSTFATWQNAAPATPSRKATSQSAAPATKNYALALDTLLIVLRLSRKTRKRPPILWLGTAKTSMSCETSSTLHTLKVRIVSQRMCTAPYGEN